MATTTDSNGYYQFGTRSLLSVGSYTVTPSGDFIPVNKDVTISTQALGNLGDVSWPVYDVDFEFLAETKTLFDTRMDYDVGDTPRSVTIST